jgi:hypothetical protein
MTRNWVAALSALLVAGACHAGGLTVKDKDAPTTFATAVGCTTEPVAHEEPTAGDCGHCGCGPRHGCLGKCKDWLCFCPLRTCPCECKHCSSCHPPLYLYFLRPCVEGKACYHYPDNCSSCVRGNCGSCGWGRGWGWLHGWTGGCCGSCESCK